MGCFSITCSRTLILLPRAPKRVETSGNASTRLQEPLESQKFGFRRQEGEKRAFRITSNLTKLARRRREEPESSHQVGHGPPEATEKAGQHSLPGGSQARDPSGKSRRRDSVEWSEEHAIQDPIRRFVKCRGRRFSRDLLDLPLYTYIMERKGSGKCERVEGYGIVTLEGCAFLGGATYLP